MRMISYAQNHEDVLLDRVFPRGVPGTYIDVGAFDPVVNSVTKHFYDLGWHGINVEPAAAAFARLASARERDINLNVGLSGEPGALTLYESSPESGWSTFEADQAAWHREEGLELLERTVQVLTLREVCDEFVDGSIDFVSIDVEGHERAVLEGGDWDRWRPRVVLVEATKPGTPVPSHGDWEPILLNVNYQFVAFDGLNRYYVRGEDAHLARSFEAPANVLDDYLPYSHHKSVEDLRNALASTQRTIAAARAANEALQAQSALHSEELEFLRAEQQRLDVVLAQIHGRHESALALFRDTRVLHDEMGAEIRALRAALEDLTADVGPSTVAVARSLVRVSRRIPGTVAAVRAARAIRRRLLAANR